MATEHFDKYSVDFLAGDCYPVRFQATVANRCPPGFRIHSVTMEKGGERTVVYEALCDMIDVPIENFFGESREDIIAFDTYRADLKFIMEYRQKLIDKGHRDLRKPS